jgi:glycosyltransferase involved in cell wall biosynthesis
MHKVDIMLVTKDRPSEVALLLQSLRTQTFQNWDLFICDDRSGIPLQAHHFLNMILNRLKLENHIITMWRNDIPLGVTRLRKNTMEKIMKYGNGNLVLRLDDDNILQPDYIERLIKVIDSGYDIASGVVPHIGIPFIKREIKCVKPFISDVKLNEKGEIIYFGDDCGMEYIEDEIIPSVNFRSMALIKKKVHEDVEYEDNLGFCSYREEQWFSFKSLLKGYKIGVDTGAIAYHLFTPSGGERTNEYQNGIQTNHELLSKWCQKVYKEKGDFLEEYRNKIKKEVK